MDSVCSISDGLCVIFSAVIFAIGMAMIITKSESRLWSIIIMILSLISFGFSAQDVLTIHELLALFPAFLGMVIILILRRKSIVSYFKKR